MTASLSILAGATPADVTAEPFAHLVRLGCLETGLFERLSTTMPRPGFPAGTPQNYLALLNPFALDIWSGLNADWRAFADHHVSGAFYRELVGVLGSAIRRTHPTLEDRIGVSLEDASTIPHHDPAVARDPKIAAIRLGFQFSYNTPVVRESSVREAHIDKRRRLVSALLYMPDRGDDAGGDLALYRYRHSRRLDDVAADLADVEEVRRVAYEPNTLIVFVNSVDAVHGVLPRRPTTIARRYVNLFVDVADDFIDTAPYQVTASAPA